MRTLAITAGVLLGLCYPAHAIDRNLQKVQTLVGRLPVSNAIQFLPFKQRQQAICVSLAIYKEARSLPEKAQFLVAETIYNRAEDKDLTECEVISRPMQFPWAAMLPRNWRPDEEEAWIKAQNIAFNSKFSNNYARPKCRVTYFNTILIPAHRRVMRCSIVVTEHIYYSIKGP
jgi:hypothetical protein